MAQGALVQSGPRQPSRVDRSQAGELTCNDDAHSLCVILGPPSTAKHLHDIQRAQLLPVALGWVVHLSALDDDCVGWQVHTPCQSGC